MKQMLQRSNIHQQSGGMPKSLDGVFRDFTCKSHVGTKSHEVLTNIIKKNET